MWDLVEEYFSDAFYEILAPTIGVLILMILNIIYLFNLNNYNKEVMNRDVFSVMTYANGASWIYLILALFLVVIFGITIWGLFHFRHEIEYRVNIFVLLFYGILCVIQIILIFIFINNPILKSAIIVTLFALGTAMNN